MWIRNFFLLFFTDVCKLGSDKKCSFLREYFFHESRTEPIFFLLVKESPEVDINCNWMIWKIKHANQPIYEGEFNVSYFFNRSRKNNVLLSTLTCVIFCCFNRFLTRHLFGIFFYVTSRCFIQSFYKLQIRWCFWVEINSKLSLG